MKRRFTDINKGALIARLLIGAGLAMIAYYYGTGVYTYFVQNELRQSWRGAVSSRSARPASGVITDLAGRDIFGRIRIPKLGLDVIVLEGTDRTTLTKGPGHIIGTALPWEGGNTAISGHRTTFGAPFAHLDQLRNGDKVRLSTVKGEFTYKVTGRAVVKPTDLSVIGRQFADRLTLTTCDPPGSAVRRLAVWAQKE